MKTERETQYKALATELVRIATIAAETVDAEKRDNHLDVLENIICNSLASAYYDGYVDSIKDVK